MLAGCMRDACEMAPVCLRDACEMSERCLRDACENPKGAFKYYVIKEVGGWGQKMEIHHDSENCNTSKSWVGRPKKIKNMMT